MRKDEAYAQPDTAAIISGLMSEIIFKGFGIGDRDQAAPLLDELLIYRNHKQAGGLFLPQALPVLMTLQDNTYHL